MNLCAKILLLVCLVAGSSLAAKRYHGYNVYRVVPRNVVQLKGITTLQDDESISFWRDGGLHQATDIMIPPQKIEWFQNYARSYGLEPELRLENVQRTIDEEMAQIQAKRRASAGAPKLEWTSYYPLEDIYAWLDEQANTYSNVQTVVAGRTYENREIRGIKITNGNSLPGVIIEAGIHAREWIGPAATSYIVNEILRSANNSVWRQFNYLYIPVFNPDGYTYTFTDDRLWRKTRKPYGTCYGADPNRNFDNHWLEGGGSSNNPCSETYAGSEPASEIETQTLSAYFRNVSSNYDIYLAFHSYAQIMIYPWGWTSQHAPLYDLWKRVGDLSADGIASVHGTEFVVGDVYSTIYPASGISTDWYYGEFNSTLTYTWETRDTIYGFQLPARQIIPVAEEHLVGVQICLEEYLKL